MNYKKIKGLIVDLDDTLYEYKPCNDFALKKTLYFLSKKLGINIYKSRKIFFEARKEVKKTLGKTAGSHSRKLYFKTMIEKISGKTRPALTLETEKKFWKGYFTKMKLRKNAKKVFLYCKKNKIKVVIATNLTAGIQLKKILKLGLENLTDLIFTSEEAGKEKPDPFLTNLAIKRSGLKPEQTVFIGDKEDRVAAKKAGIHFFLIRNDSDWKHFYEKISE